MTGTGKVTVETLQRLVDAFNAHDLDAVMSFFADDAVLEMPRGPHPWGRRLQGRKEVRSGLASRFAGIPDVHYGEDRHWVSGDRGCSEWLLTGTTPEIETIDSSPVYTADMTKRTMQEATFLILTALAAGSQHGYGIIADVAQISDGRVRLRAGTLYSALDRLRLDGLITVDREEIVEGRLRRYYRLTPEGSSQLAAEAARFQSNAAAAFARLGLAGGMTR